jgi:hypothetical protein
MNGERWREGGKARQRNFCLVWRCTWFWLILRFGRKKSFEILKGREGMAGKKRADWGVS